MFVLRILLALAVIGLFAFPMVRGWDIVQFSVARSGLGEAEDPGVFQPWVNVPGLAFTARDAALSVIANTIRDDTRTAKLDTAIGGILAVKPVSSGYWLSLAKLRFGPNQNTHDEMEPLSLSVLTGPNEGTVMPWRGIFGLSLWENASPEVRRRTIIDLAAGLPEISEQQQSAAQAVIQQKPENVRQEIRSLLLAGHAPPSRLSGIGL